MALHISSGEEEPGLTYDQFSTDLGISGTIYSSDKQKIFTYLHGAFSRNAADFAASLREIADWVDQNSSKS